MQALVENREQGFLKGLGKAWVSKTSDVDDFLNIYGGDNRVTRFTIWNSFTSKEEALFYINTCTCIPHPYCKSICINKCSIRLS
ncbi:hypothetical protein G4B88_020076 [Cannabis sativa]|uniref:Uncharacterized protein n=1 Tax=Cannabis sativa TaxID=3483 RepID=A0A7J6GLE8_CANSA|nr:hypothetical protein G4B88_020076 [Cannabis sativa]